MTDEDNDFWASTSRRHDRSGRGRAPSRRSITNSAITDNGHRRPFDQDTAEIRRVVVHQADTSEIRRTRAHLVVEPLEQARPRSQADTLLLRLAIVGVAAVLIVPLASAFRPAPAGAGTLRGTSPAGAVDEPSALPASSAEGSTSSAAVAASSDPATSNAAPASDPAASGAPSSSAAASSSTGAPGSTGSERAASGQVALADPSAGDTPTAIDEGAEASEIAEKVEPVCAMTYTVVAGDYWIRLAEAADVSLAALLEANLASEHTPLYPGEEICLPAGARMPAPPTTAPPSTTPPTTAPPTTAPPTTTPPTTAPPRTYTPAEVEDIIRFVWPDELEGKAIDIARRESNLIPTARNWCCFGLFQIYWNVHRSWLATIGVTSSDQLLDPATNAVAAYTLYQRSGGWGPWGG